MSADRKPVKGETWAGEDRCPDVTVIAYLADEALVVAEDRLGLIVLRLPAFLYRYRPPAPPRPALPETEVVYVPFDDHGPLGSWVELYSARRSAAVYRNGLPIAKRTTSYEWVEDPS